MTPNANPNDLQLELEVIVSEDDKTVYVKFTGFKEMEDADQYAAYLSENLPLLLFESEIKH